MYYLAMLSVLNCIVSGIRWLMKDELGEIWKEAIVTELRYF
jgi:hypothetical protein